MLRTRWKNSNSIRNSLLDWAIMSGPASCTTIWPENSWLIEDACGHHRDLSLDRVMHSEVSYVARRCFVLGLIWSMWFGVNLDLRSCIGLLLLKVDLTRKAGRLMKYHALWSWILWWKAFQAIMGSHIIIYGWLRCTCISDSDRRTNLDYPISTAATAWGWSSRYSELSSS